MSCRRVARHTQIEIRVAWLRVMKASRFLIPLVCVYKKVVKGVSILRTVVYLEAQEARRKR